LQKRIILPIGMILLFAAILILNTGEEIKNADLEISEAWELMEKNSEKENFILLDVRTPEEFEAGHLGGAVNLDFYGADFRKSLAQLDTGNIYLVYCRSGNRSSTALGIMEELGFKEAYNLLGGIIAWEGEGFPVVKPD